MYHIKRERPSFLPKHYGSQQEPKVDEDGNFAIIQVKSEVSSGEQKQLSLKLNAKSSFPRLAWIALLITP
jgi:hypothetical protein